MGAIPPRAQEALAEGLESAGALARPFAVRSSASGEDSLLASFAGIHESFLNARGLDRVMDAIKRCYASLWSPRAMAYRRRMRIPDNLAAMAIVLMEMVEAESSGIAFSCDPHTGRKDTLVVNANFGLGESIVTGAADPDEYRLGSGALVLDSKKIGRKQAMTLPAPEGGTDLIPSPGSATERVLSDDQLTRLGKLAIRIFETIG